MSASLQFDLGSFPVTFDTHVGYGPTEGILFIRVTHGEGHGRETFVVSGTDVEVQDFLDGLTRAVLRQASRDKNQLMLVPEGGSE